MTGTTKLDTWNQRAEGFRHAEAEVLLTMSHTMRENPSQYSKGMTWKDVKKTHENLTRAEFFSEDSCGFLDVYDNKMRALFKQGKAGKHKVLRDGKLKIHYFPLILHEEGLVDHKVCEDCSVGDTEL